MFRSELFVVLAFTLLATASAAAIEADSAKQVTDSLRQYQAQQVVVTGTRNEVRLKDSPVRVEVIGQERIKTTAMVSLGDLLREQTGLMMQGNVRTGVQMNGLGPDYTMILIDGQPMIGRVAGVIDLSRLSVGNVDRVEVVKGPMSSMYGSEALAGAINIITKRAGDGWSGNAQAQYLTNGPFDLRLEGAWGSDDVEVTGFANYKNAASFTLPLDTLNIPYSGYQDGTAQAKVTVKLDKFWKLRGWFRGFGSETKGEFIESVFGQIASNSGSVQQWDLSSTIGTEYIEGRARLTLNAYASTYHERYNFDTAQGSAGTIDDMTRRMARFYGQYDLVLGESNRLTMGGEFLYDDISGTRYAVPGDSNAQPFYRTWVGFAQWEGMPTDWISYVLSARYDANNVYGDALSPRLSILWKPGEHLRLSGSVGTGFKAPDFRQLFVVFSNRLAGAGYDLIGAARLGNTLEPERSVSYDLALRYEDGQRELSPTSSLLYNAEVRLFRNDLFNLIEYYLYGTVDNRNVYSYRNLARAYTQGLEVNLTTALVFSEIGTFTLSGGYQFLQAMDVEVLDAIDEGLAGTIDDPLTRDEYGGLWNRSQNSGTLRLQYDDSDRLWSGNVRFQFIGRYGDESLDKNGIVISDPPRKVLDREDEYVDGYTVINIAVTRQFRFENGMSFSVGAGINNLLNKYDPILIPGLVGTQYFVQMSTRF